MTYAPQQVETGHLKGRVCIVTGGSSGIGRATSIALARKGAHVVVAGRCLPRIEHVLAEVNHIPSDGSAVGFVLDIRSESETADMVRWTIERFERIDVLICCAGILRTGVLPRFAMQLSMDEWGAVINTNLTGMFLSNRGVASHMIKRREGQIINISSAAGLQGRAYDSAYCASKAAVIGLTETLKKEVAHFGVSVRLVLPGPVATPMLDQNGPIPRPADVLQPERVADLITWLVTRTEDGCLDQAVITPFGLSLADRQSLPGGSQLWAGRHTVGPALHNLHPIRRAKMSEDPRDEGLANQVAIVTGGGSGIGRAASLAIARAGARVVVVDNDLRRVQQTILEIERQCDPVHGEKPAEGLVLDVRCEDHMEKMASRTVSNWGRIDILVASAGILRAPGTQPKLVTDMSIEDWQLVIDTNLTGVFLSNRAVVPTMIRQRRGSVINLSSVSGRAGRAYDSAYCASKFGVIGFSESLAEEVRQYNVRIQTVLPDAVDTPLWEQNGPIPPPGNAIPAVRVADLIVFLLKLPEDTVLVNPVLSGFHSRARKRRTLAQVEDDGRAPAPL